MTYLDEFSSQDSGCDHNTDSCGEESSTKAAPNIISSPSIGRCRAIYDYDANLFDELTIRTGTLIGELSELLPIRNSHALHA